MESVKITVTGSNARVTETPVVTAGTVGLPAEFIFDEAWQGLAKTAVFRAGSRSYPASCVQNTAIVPWEVLEKPGVSLNIGIMGVGEDGIKIPTVWANAGIIQPGTALPDTQSQPPTPEVYDQILAAASSAVEKVDALRREADSGAFKGDKGDKGDAGVVDFQVVMELPETGDSSKIYLLPEADGKEPNRFGEYLFIDGAWERIGSAGVEVNLEEYVKKTDKAGTDGTLGLVSINQYWGINIHNNGRLMIQSAKQTDLDGKSNAFLPITPSVLDYAVKVGITTNTCVLTQAEQQAAMAWLGVTALLEAQNQKIAALEARMASE